jgi:hypothetical protein
MTRPIPAIWLIFAVNLGLGAMACQPGGVGDPCTPEDEYQTTFGGYDETEVNVESRSFQCETRVCLVNHFRGRVSCPYGQTEDDLNKDGPDPARCRVPGTNGGNPNDVIAVAVKPQLVQRSATATSHGGDQVKESVYCSCRCANAQGSRDDGANYCDCPSGFSCEQLIDDLGLGSKQLAGAYCIKEGTKYVPGTVGLECSSTAQNCGNDGKNPP